LNKFVCAISEDGLDKLSEVVSFFFKYRYSPDFIYLEYETVKNITVRVDKLSDTPYFSYNSDLKNENLHYDKIGKYNIQTLLIKPKTIHSFEVKTSDPYDFRFYTPNQKKAINALSDSKEEDIKFYVIGVPLHDNLPLKGTSKILVYELKN